MSGCQSHAIRLKPGGAAVLETAVAVSTKVGHCGGAGGGGGGEGGGGGVKVKEGGR